MTFLFPKLKIKLKGKFDVILDIQKASTELRGRLSAEFSKTIQPL